MDRKILYIILLIILLIILTLILLLITKTKKSDSNIFNFYNEKYHNIQNNNITGGDNCDRIPLIWNENNIPMKNDWESFDNYLFSKSCFTSDLITRLYKAYKDTDKPVNSPIIYDVTTIDKIDPINISGNIYNYKIIQTLTGTTTFAIPGMKKGEALFGLICNLLINNIDTGIYIIAIRGTQDFIDWLENLSANKICPEWIYGYSGNSKLPLCGTYDKCGFGSSIDGQAECQVHRGFDEIYTSIPDWKGSKKKSLRQQILSFFATHSTKIKHLVICGHSLGGALTTLLFSDILTNKMDIFGNIPKELYLIAAPRAVNFNYVDSLIDILIKNKKYIRIYNLINDEDLVPKVPPTFFPSNYSSYPNMFFDPRRGEVIIQKVIDTKIGGETFTFSSSDLGIVGNHCISTYQKGMCEISRMLGHVCNLE